MMPPEHDPGVKVVDAWEWRKARENRLHSLKRRDESGFSERFVRSTPLEWTTRAARLPGKCLQIGQALWYVSGLRKNKTVKLSHQRLQLFGVSRHAYARCLALMEGAGLVSVKRRRGKTALVTILDV